MINERKSSLDGADPSRGGSRRHQERRVDIPRAQAAMRRLECATTTFGGLRGGVLADAPGLGKTVTVLALALATAGELPAAPEAFWDRGAVDAAFAALAKDGLALNKEVLAGLRGLLDHRDRFRRATAPFREADALLQAATPPFHFRTVGALEARVRRGAGSVKTMTPAARDDLRLDFAHAMAIMRCRLDGKRRAALLGPAGRRALAERAVKPTGGTLIVVPDALLDHWRTQLARHVDLRRMAPSFGNGFDGDGCVFVHGERPARHVKRPSMCAPERPTVSAKTSGPDRRPTTERKSSHGYSEGDRTRTNIDGRRRSRGKVLNGDVCRGRGVAATRLHGIATSRPRRRRDSSKEDPRGESTRS